MRRTVLSAAAAALTLALVAGCGSSSGHPKAAAPATSATPASSASSSDTPIPEQTFPTVEDTPTPTLTDPDANDPSWPAAPVGRDAFVAQVSGLENGVFLKLGDIGATGQAVCDGFARGVKGRDLEGDFTTSGFSPADAVLFIAVAVKDLCPQEKLALFNPDN